MFPDYRIVTEAEAIVYWWFMKNMELLECYTLALKQEGYCIPCVQFRTSPERDIRGLFTVYCRKFECVIGEVKKNLSISVQTLG